MSAIIGGKVVEEIVADYTESINNQGPASEKSYLCLWSDRFAVANAMLGAGITAPVFRGPAIFPLAYPHPESPNIFCNNVTIEGKGVCTPGPKQNQYQYALIRSNFGRPDWNQLTADDPAGALSFDQSQPMLFATQELDFAYETLYLKGFALKFLGGDKIPNVDRPIRIANVTYALDLHYFPYLPAITAQNITGTLNTTTFLGCAPGRLRFDGARSRMQSYSNGVRVKDMSYRFTYRTIAPWDFDYNPATNKWEQVVGVDGSPLIDKHEFMELLPAQYLY